MTAYYVDPDLGSNANAGTDQAAPIAGYSKSGFLAALSAGDVVMQKCGTTYTGTVVNAASGSAGNPIRFTSYGTGAKPKINANGGAGGAFYASAKTDIEIDGFELYGATAGGTGGAHFLNCERVKASNCYSHGNDWGLRVDNTSSSTQTGFTLTENIVEDSQQGGIVVVCGSSAGGISKDVTIKGNRVANSGVSGSTKHGIFVASRASSYDATRVVQGLICNNNTVDGAPGYGMLIQGAMNGGSIGGEVIRNEITGAGSSGVDDSHSLWLGGCVGLICAFNKVHDNGGIIGGSNGSGVGIFIDQFVAAGGRGSDCVVMGNHIYNQGDFANTGSFPSAGIYVLRNTRTKIVGNLIHDCRQGIVVLGASGSNTDYAEIYNNTIADCEEYGVALANLADNIVVKNNLALRCEVGFFEQSGASAVTNVTREYNCAFGNPAFNWAAGVEATPTSGSAGTGDVVVDPLMSSTYRLPENSPIRRLGQAMSGLRDFFGKEVLGRPDIGAFQYMQAKETVERAEVT